MKDLLVHIDGGGRSEMRINAALTLAKRLGARLTALFARADGDRVSATARMPSAHFKQSADDAEALFAKLTAEFSVKTRFWRMPHGEPNFTIAEFAFCARYFDLVIMGQHDATESLTPDDMVEQVILNCGRPVLVIPYVGQFPTIGERAVVAWNASPVATRAVHDAVPLLIQAEEVTVLSLRPPADDEALSLATMPPVDLVDHLCELGAAARAERLPDEDIGKMDMLLSRVCDHGADLLVMGAHGNYGLARLRGSSTRWMLKQMTVPVLMSH